MSQADELELVAGDNTAFDQDGNWRIHIDAGGHLVIELRDAGSCVEEAAWASLRPPQTHSLARTMT